MVPTAKENQKNVDAVTESLKADKNKIFMSNLVPDGYAPSWRHHILLTGSHEPRANESDQSGTEHGCHR